MLTEREKKTAVSLLFDEDCSCVIRRGDCLRIFRQRGVRDLLQLLHDERSFTEGAFIADKVVGKGAAALMVLCGFGEVFAGTVSTPARLLLEEAGIALAYNREVPHIINRRGDGVCPVESLCADCRTAAECLPKIEAFVASMAK